MKTSHRTARPTLVSLEDRDVPAAFVFSAGTLTINMAEVADRSVTVGSSNPSQPVIIDGHASGGRDNYVVGAANGRLMPLQVSRIVVNGSEQNDAVNLSGVDSRAFRNLSGNVVVYGNGGADTIRGTAFDDEIHGGGGNDRLSGLDGDDRLWGDAGNDEVWGDGAGSGYETRGGNDRIDGGSGDDYLAGGGGNDLLIGGAGNDRFDGDGGIDTIWIDYQDYRPAHGWPAEYVRTGTPPRI